MPLNKDQVQQFIELAEFAIAEAETLRLNRQDLAQGLKVMADEFNRRSYQEAERFKDEQPFVTGR